MLDRPWLTFVLAVTLAGTSVPAFAQPFEQAGVRALGMGGAFVAVADDASAVYWNPAGFATGDYFGGLVEHQRAESDSGPLARGGASMLALGMPALGVAYYRLTSVVLTPGAASSVEAQVTRVATHNVAASLLQSIGDHLVVGTTVRGGTMEVGLASAPPGTSGTRAAALAADSPQFSRGLFDADVGMMVKFRNVRAGATVRNLRAPSVRTPAGTAHGLGRQARAGLAFLPHDQWTLAADIDLTADPMLADRQMMALGVERRGTGRAVALRAGTRFSVTGVADPRVSVGASVPTRAGMWLDGQLTLGSSAADHSWGVSARVGF